MTNISSYRCGYVAIVGRPNVGKSTLMNRLLGQKISITSPKPQTTRHRILGIKTMPDYQAVFVDTPGLHLGGKKAVNRYMNRAAATALSDVDIIIFVVDANRWSDEDENVLQRLAEVRAPVILAVNKVDRIKDKNALLPLLARLSEKGTFSEVIPLTALRGENVTALEEAVVRKLPESEPFFPEEMVTDRTERFLAAELIREKLMRKLGKELPYALTVEIEQFAEEDGLIRIAAVIWVERSSQKKIVIGKGGSVLKDIGRQAREEMQRLFDAKVFLELWVKVKEGWSDDERSLRSLGYRDE